MEFFSADGIRLGDRDSLKQEIHEITGIRVPALQGRSLSEFSTEERMSWARNRETKLQVDRVYCLLGIFSVYMPLIYGEEVDHAFERLNDEINPRNKRIGMTGKNEQLTLPFRRDEEFIDRPIVLGQISQRCSVRGSCTALVGLGGVG